MMPNFWHLPAPLTQFSKFNNFLWVCWFLDKNLSNFVPPVWKLHNPYCHSLRQWVWLFIVICPQGGFFLIIRFPNLESSAWGTKFSSGPVEQTGTVGICLHLLLADNPIPLMGADCTHHIVSTQLIWQCSAGPLLATGRRTDFLKFDLRQFHVSLNFKFKLNLTEA